MESVERVTYGRDRVEDFESELGNMVKVTLDQGLNEGEGGLLNFRLPADPIRFTDLNSIYMKVALRITGKNKRELKPPPKPTLGLGTARVVRDAEDSEEEVEIPKTGAGNGGEGKKKKRAKAKARVKRSEPSPEDVDADLVFLDSGGIHSLFSSCEVKINDTSVSMSNAYPYSAALSRFLGCSEESRSGVWDTLDGSWSPVEGKSSIVGGRISKYALPMDTVAGSRQATFVGRVFSDLLMSSRQYLPPGHSLGIELRRARSDFALCCLQEGDDHDYSIVIDSMSLYFPRLHLRPSIVSQISGLASPSLIFNRLETRMMSIPQGTRVWRWLDCLNGATLPNRIYVSFVSQRSLYGHFGQNSSYFETLNMSSLNAKLNGWDLLVEPIRTRYRKYPDGSIQSAQNETDAREGYLSILEILGLVSDQTSPLRLSYHTYINGASIYGVELGKVGQKSGTAAGPLDLEVHHFPTPPPPT